MKHLEFVCQLYKLQAEAGRLFLHEHPAQASSWEEDCIGRTMEMAGVQTITMDHCQLGRCDSEGHPVIKQTKWMSNSEHILKALN